MSITRTQVFPAVSSPLTTGRLTLVGGTFTDVGVLANHTVNARVTLGVSTAAGVLGFLSYMAAVNDLTITSTSGTDTSTVDYMVFG